MSLLERLWAYVPSRRAFISGTIALLIASPALLVPEAFSTGLGIFAGAHMALYYVGGYVWDKTAGAVGRVRRSPTAE